MLKHRNADGTYNGVTLLAELTGISPAEIKWSFDRLKELMRVEGKTKREALDIVREECKRRPWETPC